MPIGRIVAGLIGLTILAGGFSGVALLLERRWGRRGIAVLTSACCLMVALVAAMDPERRQFGIWLAVAGVAFVAFIAPAVAIGSVGRREPAWSTGKRWFSAIGASYLAVVACLSAVVLAALATRAVNAIVG